MADDSDYDHLDPEDFEGEDYSPPDLNTGMSGMRRTGPPADTSRLTGQIAPTPQPVYQGQNPDDEEFARPRKPTNMTGDPTTNTLSFAEPTPAPDKGDASFLQPFAGQAGPSIQPSGLNPSDVPAQAPGRAVKSVAPIRFVTNSQGKRIPINAGGNDALNPIPGNTKYVTGKDGELYHAQPDDTGTFTRAEDSLKGTPDGQGNLVAHVPGHGNVTLGPDPKFAAKALEKQQKDAQKAADTEAKNQTLIAEAGTANLLEQSRVGWASVNAAKDGAKVIDERMVNEVERARSAHDLANIYLKSTQQALTALTTKAASNPDQVALRQLQDDDEARAYAKAAKEGKEVRHTTAVKSGPNAHGVTPWDDDKGAPIPPLSAEDRKRLEDDAAKEQKALADAKANHEAAARNAAFARTQIEVSKAKKADWLAQKAVLNQGLAETTHALDQYQKLHILANTGRLPSQEAQPAPVDTPPDFNKYNADVPQPTIADRQKAGKDITTDGLPANALTPSVRVDTAAPTPSPIPEAQQTVLGSISKADHGIIYNVPDQTLQFSDGSVMTPDGKVMAEIQRGLNHVPRLYLSPDASGQYHSLSLKSGHPYDGVPEYQAPLPYHVEAMKAQGVDTSDKAALQSAWEAGHWTPERMSKFLSDWQGANDDERQDLIAQANPNQASLPKGQRELNTRDLYRSGQISLQEARHLDFLAKGRAPGMQDPDGSFTDFRAGDSPEAKYLRSFDQDTGLNPISLNLKAKATAAAVAAWGADYIRRNGNSADFDPQAFAKARDAMYGKHMGPFERVAGGAEDMAEGLAGFIPSIPTAAINFGLGLAKRGGKLALQKLGINPTDVKDVADAYGFDQVGDVANLAGLRPQTDQEMELMRQRTEQFGHHAYTFFSGRANLESAKDLLNGGGSRGGPSSALWYGKDGAKIKDTTDSLFDLVDKDQMTEEAIKKLGGKLNDLVISQHGITNYDRTNKNGYDYNGRYDVTDARSPLAQMLASYVETRDPAYKEMFRQSLFTSAGEAETQKALAEYMATKGHVAGSPVGTVLDWLDRNTRHSLNYQDPHAFETLRTSATDTTQPLQVVGASLALEGLSAVPGLLRIGKGALSPVVKGTGHALLDSAKVAAGASINDVLPAYTIRALEGTASPMAAGAKQLATSAAHGGAFMGMTAVGSPGASMGDVAQATGEGMAIGTALGLVGAVKKGLSLTTEGRAKEYARIYSERFPQAPVSSDMVLQSSHYVGQDEPGRIALMRDLSQQIADTQKAIKAGTATPEETAHLQSLRDSLDSQFAEQQLAMHRAISATQEINGIADPNTRNFVHALLKSRQGATLTGAERSGLLRMVDTTATPDVNGMYPSLAPEQPDGSFVITDAGLNALRDAAPRTVRDFGFPASETEQLDALKQPQPVAPDAVAQPQPAEAPLEPPANLYVQRAEAAKAARQQQQQVQPPPAAPEPVQDPRKLVRYQRTPEGGYTAAGETYGHPQDFESEQALNDYLDQHHGPGRPERPETPKEAVSALREQKLRDGHIALHDRYLRAKRIEKGLPVPEAKASKIIELNIEPKTQDHATRPISPAGAEHQGVPPGEHVQENRGEVRQGPGEQTGGGGGLRGEGAEGEEAQPVHEAAASKPGIDYRDIARKQVASLLKGTKLEGLVHLHEEELPHMVPADGREVSGGMEYQPDHGGGQINVSLPTFERQMAEGKFTAKEAQTRIKLMLDEELKHHADEMALQGMYKGPPEEYGQWAQEYGARQWRDDFTEAQRADVAKRYGSTFNAMPDHIKAAEARRMLLQLRETGGLTEEWNHISAGFMEYLSAFARAIREMVKGGKIPEALEKQLQAAEAILKDNGYTGPHLEEKAGPSPADKVAANFARIKAEKMRSKLPANDAAAHEAATSPLSHRNEPTQAQKEAGNYKKGRMKVGPLDIAIENPQGSVRSGTDENGEKWVQPMDGHYGYVKRTTGSDKQKIDIFVAPNTPPEYKGPVFVVNQVDAKGRFNEHKSLTGTGIDTPEQALTSYKANYEPGWDRGRNVVKFDSLQAFHDWATEKPRKGELKQAVADAYSKRAAAREKGKAKTAALPPEETSGLVPAGESDRLDSVTEQNEARLRSLSDEQRTRLGLGGDIQDILDNTHPDDLKTALDEAPKDEVKAREAVPVAEGEKLPTIPSVEAKARAQYAADTAGAVTNKEKLHAALQALSGRERADVARRKAQENAAGGAANLALRKANAGLPEAAAKLWTPEVYAKAAKFYESGDESHLEGLTPIQKKRVHAVRIESDPQAAAAEQAQEEALRKQQAEDLRHARATTDKNREVIHAAPVTPEQDKAYLDAVESGDHETAQKLVDEAARRSGGHRITTPDTVAPRDVRPRNAIESQSQVDAQAEEMEKRGWIGRPIVTADIGDRTQALTGSHRIEAARAADIDAIPHVPIDLPSLEKWWEDHPSNIAIDGEHFVDHLREGDQMDALKEAQKSGFKAPWLQNAIDILRMEDESNWIDRSQRGQLSENPWIIGNQIKSADPITRDEQGRVIPLSERFNPQSDDIRYSAPVLPNDELHRETAQLLRDHLGLKTPEDFNRYVSEHLGEENYPAPDYPEQLYRMAFPSQEAKPAPKAEPKAPEAAKPEEKPPVEKPVDLAGIKMASVDARRKALGQEPLGAKLRQGWGKLWDRAQEALNANENAGNDLVRELARTNRTPEPWENALLARVTVERLADVDEAANKVIALRESADAARKAGDEAKAAKDDDARMHAHADLKVARERMEELEKVTDKAGTQQGRALNARKLIAQNALDFNSLAKQLRVIQEGAPLTEAQEAMVEKRSEALRAAHAEMEKKFKAHEDRTAVREAMDTHHKLVDEVKRKPRAAKVSEQAVRNLEKANEAAMRELMGKQAVNAAPADVRNSSPAGDPKDRLLSLLTDVGAYHLTKAGKDFADWRASMHEAVGDRMPPHMVEEVYRRSLARLQKELKSAEAAATPAGVLAKAKAKGLPEAGEEVDPKLVRDLARSHIEAGHQITDEASSEALTAKVHADIKELYPEATHEDVRNAAGGYKEPEWRTRADVEKQMGEYRSQSQLVAKFADASRGKMPWRMGGWEKPSDEVRRLSKAVRDMIQANDLVLKDKQAEMANAQERTRTTLKNTIADLERQIAAGERDQPLAKRPVVDDAQMTAMRERVKVLKAQFDKLAEPDMHLPGALFSEAVAKLAQAKEREAKLKAKLAANDLASKEKDHDISDALVPELRTVRKRIAELNAEVAQRRKAAGMADEQMWSRLQNTIAKKREVMKRQIATGDFSSAPKREPYQYHNDAFAKAADAAKEAFAKEVDKWNQEKEKVRLANRTEYRKWADRVVHISREFKLANLISAGEKLGGAAIETGLTKPAFDAVAQTMRLSGTLNDVRQKAVYEGSLSYKSNVAGLQRMIGQWRSVYDKLRTGKSSLDWMQKNPHIDGEMRSWFGQVHGAIKEPVRQFIYGKSLELRYAEAAKRGIDLRTDKVAAEAANAGAFGDAMTDIFMGDNLLTSGIRRMLGSMRGDKENPGAGNALADVLETLMPIINVPTNLAIRGARLHPLIGLPEAAIRIIAAKRRGELANHAAKLSEKEAEAITRAFKYGLGGLALSAYAWANPQQFGGIYTNTGDKPRHGADRRFYDPNLEPGDVKLPNNWGTINHLFAHGPVGTWMNYVADARRMYEANKAKNPNHPAANLIGPAAFTLLAPVSKLPFVSAAAQFANPYKTSEQTAGEITTNTLAAAPKMLAKAQDVRKDGVPIRRNPKTFLDELKMAVPNVPTTKWPGLRQQVPMSRRQPPPKHTASAFSALRRNLA